MARFPFFLSLGISVFRKETDLKRYHIFQVAIEGENSNVIDVLSLISNYQAHHIMVVIFSRACNPSVQTVSAGVVGVVQTQLHCPALNSKRKNERRKENYMFM